MFRLSTICLLTGALAVLVFPANVSNAESIVPSFRTTAPNVKVNPPTINSQQAELDQAEPR
jgi:hypothetical protein